MTNRLYAGGAFQNADTAFVKHVAVQTEGGWEDLREGQDAEIDAVAVDGDGNLYVGGGFTTDGGAPGNYVAKWDGATWSALGAGTNSDVLALAVYGSSLYVGGAFTMAGGSPANYIAHWDIQTESWSALGLGISSGVVIALAVDGNGTLYAGGYFNTVGGVPASNIAAWNGASWSPLGSGVSASGMVLALAAHGSNLYAGGSFTTAGGSPAIRVAMWNGASWGALGDGIDGTVNALAVDGTGTLYAGGWFSHAGGITVYNVARWNGTWNALGAGVNNEVKALAVDENGKLFAGGRFELADWQPADRVALWDGTSWSAIDQGMNGDVLALAATPGDRLFAGGIFTTAGGDDAANVAYTDLTQIGPDTYYVDIVNGDDSNDGTSEATSWGTIHHGIGQINAGSAGNYTLNVAMGTYSVGNGESDLDTDNPLIITQNNVTILGASGIGPIIDGTDADIWTKGLEITGSNVTIHNLHITNFTYGIKVDGCSPEISRNAIYDNEFNIGITAGSGQTASPTIKNNLIYETTPIEVPVVSYGIYVGGNDGSTVIPEIYHNTIDGGTYDGIRIEGTTDTPIIKYNIITNFRQSGIQNSGNPTIDYNDVWHNGPDPYETNYVGCSAGPHDISADPKYGSYTLQACSPCIDAIDSGSGDTVPDDFDGTTRPQGPARDMGAYEFQYGPPMIWSFDPTSGTTGTAVTITGDNFCGTTAVSFGGTPAAGFTVDSNTQITATVGSGHTGGITVTNPLTSWTSGTTFTYTSPSPPTITSFSPTSGGAGTVVTITGTNFTGATSVTFGGTAATSFTVNSATQITATVAGGSTGKVSVTTPGGVANSTGDFTFIGAPTITSFTPASGGAGTVVTITGTNFTGATSVTFGGTPATSFTVNSATQITATVAGGSTGTVSVSTPGGVVNSAGNFTFIPAPTITSFSPTVGGTGTTVVILGSNFTGTEVKFGGTNAASFIVDSPTQITAVVGAGSTGKVSVTTAGGTATSEQTFSFYGEYNYQLPGGSGQVTDYRIFTIPLYVGTGADMLAQMEAVLGDYDPYQWRVFALHNGAYIELNSQEFAGLQIIPGMSFWIITLYGNTVQFQGALAPEYAEYTLDLQAGWHMVALPWPATDVWLSNITCICY